MRNHALKTAVSLVAGFLLLGTTAVGYALAQEVPDTDLRAQMEQMMDQMPGGMVQQMRDSMGSDFGVMIDQCVAFMSQVSQKTTGSTGDGSGSDMMGTGDSSGMMGGGSGSSMLSGGGMRGMMRSIMGR